MSEFQKGIYAIECTANGRVYVGRSSRPLKRYEQHILLLRAGQHNIEDMQQDFYCYGENSFVFRILEQVETFCEVHNKEIAYMEKFKSHIRGLGYNYKDPYFTKRKPDTKRALHDFIETLNDEQTIYLHTLATKLFAKEKGGD